MKLWRFICWLYFQLSSALLSKSYGDYKTAWENMLKYSYLVSLFSPLYFSSLISIVSFPIPFYCFLLIFLCVCVWYTATPYEKSFLNMKIVTWRSSLHLRVEGKIYKTMNLVVPIKEMLWTHHSWLNLMARNRYVFTPTEKNLLILDRLVVTPVATILTLYYPAFLSACLRPLTKSSCQNLSAMALFSASTIIYLVYFTIVLSFTHPSHFSVGGIGLVLLWKRN